MTTTWRFAKGHGAGNDFVILDDPDGELALTAPIVRHLCDRRRGIGGDGVLRVVRTRALIAETPAGGEVDRGRIAAMAQGADLAEWFMDYRNADGSIAEMCGNGLRVFARHLVDRGLATSPVAIATLAGPRQAVVGADGEITVTMGHPRIDEHPTTVWLPDRYEAHAVDVGNPHAVVLVDDPRIVADLDLTRPPAFDPARFPEGVNIEIAAPLGPEELSMRVYERGVGETLACGTGIVATALAHLWQCGSTTGRRRITVPGGTLTVTLDKAGLARLTGPAVIVAQGRTAIPDELITAEPETRGEDEAIVATDSVVG
ncbi:MAG: diaminopimelate epimerase [Propionibacteriaceae bacterium]|jgi:diaminopimelate epimerase|nr:diaminopimelate epimerase [Propionibacteriaceae bacterium]